TSAGLSRQGWTVSDRTWIPSDEDAMWQRTDRWRFCRTGAGDARIHRRRRRSDVRHQSALECQPGGRDWQTDRTVSPVLARGSDGARRLPGPGAHRRQPDHADCRGRISLRHRAVSAFDRAPVDRHRDDRPAASGWYYTVDESRGYG